MLYQNRIYDLVDVEHKKEIERNLPNAPICLIYSGQKFMHAKMNYWKIIVITNSRTISIARCN